ncbi:unnamed protein product [Phyllotreta striolata]|uniref:superoxide dismutase n=1 Tax=Phyllotreta striolata TaxID=444603 RepID=A0A9P0DZF2_PHYSR|nr:unnamed protein product [Phyllotreta striolata]
MNLLTRGSIILLIELLAEFLVTGTEGASLQSIGVKNTLYELPGLGNRPVLIKTIPGIENYRSDIFEVYMEPYLQDLNTRVAVVLLQGVADSGVAGELMLVQQDPPFGPTLITGNVTGLPAGKHGLHVHQSGDLRQGCEKIGGHFNPYLVNGDILDPLVIKKIDLIRAVFYHLDKIY